MRAQEQPELSKMLLKLFQPLPDPEGEEDVFSHGAVQCYQLLTVWKKIADLFEYKAVLILTSMSSKIQGKNTQKYALRNVFLRNSDFFQDI